jgi:hypothetical protein
MGLITARRQDFGWAGVFFAGAFLAGAFLQ